MAATDRTPRRDSPRRSYDPSTVATPCGVDPRRGWTQAATGAAHAKQDTNKQLSQVHPLTPCPLCGAVDARPLFVKDGHAYEQCRRCGLPSRGGEAVEPSYHDYLPSLTRELPALTRRRYEDILRTLEPYRRTGRYLDVGCGGGFFVEVAQELGWEAEGLEVSEAAVAFGRERGLRLHHGTIQAVAPDAGAFDVLTMMEVLEHVFEPVELLRHCARALRPGGALYLTTPNWGSLTRRLIDSAWFPISRDHVVYFAPGTVRRACREAGLEPVRVTTANIQPHELVRHLRRRRRTDDDATPDAGRSAEPGFMDTTMSLRDRVESNPLLRAAKSVVNTGLRWTGTGDTLRVLAVKPETR